MTGQSSRVLRGWVDQTLLEPCTAIDLAHTCHPVLIENDEDSTWIGQNGTCFLVSRRQRLFAITARHCVWPASVSQLLIACRDRVCAPVIAGYQQRSLNRVLEEDEQDLYFVELDPRRLSPAHQGALFFVELETGPPKHLITISAERELCIPGFPKDRAGIDYEAKVLAPKPSVLSAWYLGPDVENSCYRLRFGIDDRTTVPSVDGFSGSPVFWVPQLAGIR